MTFDVVILNQVDNKNQFEQHPLQTKAMSFFITGHLASLNVTDPWDIATKLRRQSIDQYHVQA